MFEGSIALGLATAMLGFRGGAAGVVWAAMIAITVFVARRASDRRRVPRAVAVRGPRSPRRQRIPEVARRVVEPCADRRL